MSARTGLRVLDDLKRVLGEENAHAPLPTLPQVLYVPPLPDKARKNCSNCCMFVTSGSCQLHGPKTKISPQAVCGYWVGGKPRPQRLLVDVDYVNPSLSGLDIVKGGTSCDTCKWFEAAQPGKGTCHGVRNESGSGLASVEARGCCARWESGKK